MTEDQEANLIQLVETLREEVDALLAARDASDTISQLREQVSSIVEKVDGLSDRLTTVEADADNEGDDGDDINEQEPMPFEDDEKQRVVQPDSVEWKGDALRKSIAWAPDGTNVAQLNEFDNAPSVGALTIKRRGAKLVIADPDGTSGRRKWMVPLRREDTTKELKWAMLGDGSDSDSDSDSDYDDPCQDVYSLEDDGADSDCGTTIKLMRQSYKRGTGGECEPDGQPESAGSVTIPDPPTYALSVSGSCQKTVTLQKTPCGGSPAQAGDALTFDVPPTITATSTGNTGGGQLAGTVTVTPCGGTATNINIYNGADGSDGDDVCAPEIKENQLNISDTGSDANHFVKLCEAKAGYLFNNGSTDVCIRGKNFFIIPIPKKLYASFALKKGQGVLSGNAVSYSGGGLTIEADVYEYAPGSNSFWETKELALLSQGDLRQALGGSNYNIDFVADIEVSNNVVYVVKKTLNFDGGLCTGTTGTTRTPIFGFTNCT